MANSDGGATLNKLEYVNKHSLTKELTGKDNFDYRIRLIEEIKVPLVKERNFK